MTAAPMINSSAPIFISYARADAEDFAKRLHDHLEREGIDAWLDVRDIHTGDPWDESIWAAIEACSVFAFILTPGSAKSEVCREEFERATHAGKRIAPIMFLDTRPLPAFYPPTMQYIDYLKRGEAATLAELRLTREHVLFPPRSPEAIRAAEEAATAHALARPAPAVPTGRTRKPNPLPPKAIAGFRDRDHQRAEIHACLEQGARLIAIYGQGGVGKTSLAVEVLTELEAAPDGAAVPDLVVALRETRPNAKDLANRGISVEKIFLDTARALDDAARIQLEDIWKAPALDLPQKCAGLIQLLVDKRCLLLIDNLESLQDPAIHALTDPELVAFLEAVLPLDSSLQILLTSRERVALPRTVRNYEKLIPLAEGLPTEAALDVLIALDDDSHRLQNAPRPALKQLAARTQGYPRALEYLAALLKDDPRLTPDKLLISPALLAAEVTGALAAEAFRRLPPDQARVLEGLALFGRPVSLEALQYLLAPYLDAARIDGLLLRLMESYFVAYNPVTGTYTLHPVDLDYSLSRIPAGEPADRHADPPPYTRYVLLDRAAAYFRSIRPPKEEIARLKTLDALAPQLAEFEYLTALDDFDAAADVLTGIDYDYLLLWGYAWRVLELHTRIVDKITDKKLRGISLGNLGVACADLGQVERAIGCYEQQLVIIREIGNRQGEGADLGNLGVAYKNLGQVDKALALYRQALIIYQEIGNPNVIAQTERNIQIVLGKGAHG